jgi:CheY-like chemotaxis protein
MDPRRRSDFRVIAEGDDAVGRNLTLAQALALVELARARGRRFVAIVDDSTGALVDERRARMLIKRGAPPVPAEPLAPCPACEDEAGVPTGEVLVQLLSGTWVRDTCNLCHGHKKVLREELARRNAQVVDESTAAALAAGRRIASGTRPRVARVLVVYGEPLLAEALRLALSDEFEVQVATDAQQALASLRVGDWYDVVLCELMMPGMNGVELRDHVQVASPELAARFVFIDKPVDVRALSDLIRRLAAPGGGSVDGSVDNAGARR